MDLEREIYNKYKIDPGSINYVEMHGTGTKLGDPIELEALSTVFKEKIDLKNYCAIGSVKSNIGHASAAAGIAGIQKVLLSLKHKKLVPTLNFSKPNDQFNFKDSPFYVNTELKPWEISPGFPRRASISSFGFSGTNAHIVFQEYVEKGTDHRRQIKDQEKPGLIVLSAKTEERLWEMAKNLLNYLTVIPTTWRETLNLHDLAYTLHLGREAMEERLAMLVRSTKDLEEKLKFFVDGQDEIKDLYRGHLKRNTDRFAVFAADEDLHEAIDKWIRRGKYSKLLDLWVKGFEVDWNQLYSDTKPRRISLPTYPFAKERYWISESTGSRQPAAPLYPLAPKKTAEFSELANKISLSSLSERQILSSKPANQTQQASITLASKDTATSQALNDETPGVTQEDILKESLLEELTVSLASVLYLKPSDIDEEEKFIDMGMDSIIGVEWTKAIEIQYGLSIGATKIYDYPTLRKLARFLESELAKKETKLNKNPIRLAGSNPVVMASPQRCFAGLSQKSQLSVQLASRTFDKGEGTKEKLQHNKQENERELQLEQAVPSKPKGNADGVAIIGISGQFPKSKTLVAFWDNLAQGRDCISEIPANRWSIDEYYDPDIQVSGKTYSKWMGVLEDVDQFDPLFFNISPAEGRTDGSPTTTVS